MFACWTLPFTIFAFINSLFTKFFVLVKAQDLIFMFNFIIVLFNIFPNLALSIAFMFYRVFDSLFEFRNIFLISDLYWYVWNIGYFIITIFHVI